MADEVRLIDIIKEFISGDWGEENATEDAPCAVSCVRGADIVPISNSRFENIPVRYISASSLKNRGLSEGDIIIEKSGGSPTQSTGRTVYVSQKLVEAKKNIVCSNFCQAFRIKEGWNPLYVYYYLQVVYNSGVFFNFEGKTSGLKNLILDSAFQSITIKKVPLQEQDHVANMLSLIDDKIAANHAINDYLESMARQLYDYWFVQFDFPDENGRPYKSSGGKMVWNEKLKREIPANWRGSNICLLADILSGGTPSKVVSEYWNGSIPFFGPTDYKGGVFQLSTEEHITENGLTHCASSLFDIGTIMLTARGSIGKLVVVGTPMAMNQSCYALKSRRDEWEYLFFLTKQLIQHLLLKGGGSVFKSITTVDIETSILCIGEDNIISHFTEVVRPLFQKIKNNSEEIERMTREKEELLPLLMNGQVSVRQLNNHLSAD
ncbi:MAG: restriction endonuclease subunit S [Bacteroidales bacterium]|nr:restriction endonuclease subunit S [Bacteroidales bacterium]